VVVVGGGGVRSSLAQHEGTFLMRFSGDPGSFSISYVLDFVTKPTMRTEIRHLRFARLPEGQFAVAINNKCSIASSSPADLLRVGTAAHTRAHATGRRALIRWMICAGRWCDSRR